MKVAVVLAVLIVGVVVWRAQRTAVFPGASPVAADAPAAQLQTGGTHEDHDPKHGGIFFMAMNNHHHLEGVFEAPGIFRVYVYDAYTQPLPTEQMKQVRGTVLVGDSPPEIPLTLSRDGKTLEAALGSGAKLPATLTLLMRFPEMSMEARPELFTFPFREYTEPATVR